MDIIAKPKLADIGYLDFEKLDSRAAVLYHKQAKTFFENKAYGVKFPTYCMN